MKTTKDMTDYERVVHEFHERVDNILGEVVSKKARTKICLNFDMAAKRLFELGKWDEEAVSGVLSERVANKSASGYTAAMALAEAREALGKNE